MACIDESMLNCGHAVPVVGHEFKCRQTTVCLFFDANAAALVPLVGAGSTGVTSPARPSAAPAKSPLCIGNLFEEYVGNLFEKYVGNLFEKVNYGNFYYTMQLPMSGAGHVTCPGKDVSRGPVCLSICQGHVMIRGVPDEPQRMPIEGPPKIDGARYAQGR
uniref:Uncharacterized protein n=1 Tax=Timema genevievae TaxID=629358 RepID=A0A7R9K8N6_TIMGE|nr:unnamed protein product [Timema genevievae]